MDVRRLATGLKSAVSLLMGLGLSGTAHAGPTLDHIIRHGELRVCIWPDYYSISYRNPKTRQLSGLDIDLSRELARELGVRLRHVDSSFASLIDDVLQGRCDVAMFAIAVLPQRAQSLRFTQPYLQSGIHAITTQSNRVVRRWEDIDRPGVRVAVQQGTFMEPVMRSALQQAELVVVRPPDTREQELMAGRVDVFMSDYPYSRRVIETQDSLRLISPTPPFHPLPYAYAVKPGDEDWLARMNRFVADIRQDGRLDQIARRHRLQDIVIKTPSPVTSSGVVQP